ncbi:DUF533 domain-containing protein [Fulvivirga sp.]|uniref:DUF533 domain-containing protein n=1 Tax=Fulvivirga sp. TaxID=1931237 RepID=UPI0032ECD5FC
MDETIKRRLNILIYLAKVDGKFHKSEKKLLQDFVKEHNLDPDEFKSLMNNPEKMETEKIIDKAEMMYLALKVINADKHLDEREIEFCKELAQKLGIKPEFVKHFANRNLSRAYFDEEIVNWYL